MSVSLYFREINVATRRLWQPKRIRCCTSIIYNNNNNNNSFIYSGIKRLQIIYNNLSTKMI